VNEGGIRVCKVKLHRGILEMNMRGIVLLLLAAAGLAARPSLANGQALADPADSAPEVVNPTATSHLLYTPPSNATKLRNYAFDTFGPYPIVAAGLVAGIDQEDNSPPEWKQGAAGYGKRFASDFGIEGVTTTTRYALAQVFREDTLYYRCECNGAFPRLRHAVISTFVARRGQDGHRVFSFPALVAPYAGTMTAVYAWYPGRYNASDGFRLGNYNLLAYAGQNIALEFFYSGPHSLLSRMHLNNRHGAPAPGSNP
jgi:hypothetical protein